MQVLERAADASLHHSLRWFPIGITFLLNERRSDRER